MASLQIKGNLKFFLMFHIAVYQPVKKPVTCKTANISQSAVFLCTESPCLTYRSTEASLVTHT